MGTLSEDIKWVSKAYCFLREHNNDIPDEILEVIRHASILYLQHEDEIEDININIDLMKGT